MKQLTTSDVNVLAAYKEGNAETKKALYTLYKDQIDFNLSVFDTVKSIEDIFAITGKSISEITSPSDTKDEASYKVLKFCIKFINGDWVVDYSEGNNQHKYEPRFFSSGFGLSYDVYAFDYWLANSSCSVRLCYKSEAHAKFGAKILIEHYNNFLNHSK